MEKYTISWNWLNSEGVGFYMYSVFVGEIGNVVNTADRSSFNIAYCMERSILFHDIHSFTKNVQIISI